MKHFEQAIRLVNKGDFMASTDLMYAHYSVKIAEEQQKYFCFKWSGKIYHFTCLANGVSEDPCLFTKLMKPVSSALSLKGHIIMSFIDDSLMCSKSMEGCYACLNDRSVCCRKLGSA